MYSGLSQDFLRMMKLPAQKHFINGTIGSTNLTAKNIIQGSVRISNSSSSSSNISIGSVHIGQLNITLTGLNIPRGTYKGKEIVLYENLLTDFESETWEAVKLGHFTIDDPEYSSQGVEIVAYDNMAKFDKEIDSGFIISGDIYDFAHDACVYCGVTFGMTRQEVQAMPNGNETLGLYGQNDIEYFRDLISWCAQTLGANALINRDGELIFKCYSNNYIETFVPKDRYEGGKCSDFTSFFTSISMVNTKGNTTSYYSLSPDNGSMMELGNNPLLQPTTDSQADMDAIEVLRRRVLTAISVINYVPFTANIHRPFIYDLMDVIKLSGGIVGNDDILSCITSYSWSYMNGYTIQCVGSKPALSSKKAKKDRAVNDITPIINEMDNDIVEIKDDVDDISGTVSEIIDDIDGITELVDEKQNQIDVTTTFPTGGNDGDISFYSSDNGQTYTPYINNNGTWTQIPLGGNGNLITYGTSDKTPGTSPLPTGTVYLMYE